VAGSSVAAYLLKKIVDLVHLILLHRESRIIEKGCVRAEPGGSRGDTGTAADTTGAAGSDSSAALERFDLQGRPG